MNMSESQQCLLNHWSDLRGQRGSLPARGDFTLRGVGKHATNMIVVDVKMDPLDFEYRLMGTAVVEFLNRDYTGVRLSGIPGKGPDSDHWSFMRKTIEDGEPRFFEVPYIGPRAGKEKIYTLYLPVASDHRHTDKIIMVPQFRTKTAIIQMGTLATN